MRKLKTPRLYTVDFTYDNGKLFSMMLGVSFNNNDRSKLISRFQGLEWKPYRGFTHVKTELKVEKLFYETCWLEKYSQSLLFPGKKISLFHATLKPNGRVIKQELKVEKLSRP